MSRIGRKPVAAPAGLKIDVSGKRIAVEGPQGKLDWTFPEGVDVAYDEKSRQVVISRKEDSRQLRALHGLTRSMIQNMVDGVSKGYEKKLEIVGVGYIGSILGSVLQLRVGFANEIQKPIPAGLKVTCPDQTHIVIKGMDKQKVGQFAAEVRAVRKPEPYKGKGIRYDGEVVRRKAGKAVTK
ncbi:MAG TPA: 50S ribosomal protein L6 [Pirellulales bacterium]|jgi:large subunit ribosomal protein L6